MKKPRPVERGLPVAIHLAHEPAARKPRSFQELEAPKSPHFSVHLIFLSGSAEGNQAGDSDEHEPYPCPVWLNVTWLNQRKSASPGDYE